MKRLENTRAWCFTTPAWFDHAQEDDDGLWWDPARRQRRPMGTLKITRQEREQAYHAGRFAQWASHELASTAHKRGYEACRRAVMRLVAAWGEEGIYSDAEDEILEAWFKGKSVSDHLLAEEARSFGYSAIAEVLEPIAEDLENISAGLTSLHRGRRW